jgi:high-affinity nickel-transport protein
VSDGDAMSPSHEGLRLGLLATATGLGFRHGIDWDHIAAITDLTAAQDNARTALASATCYFVGHGLVVGALGAAAIVAGEHVPGSVDHVMERLVGVTLVALGFYVLVSLVRNGRNFRMRSRWMLVFAGVRRLRAWARRSARQSIGAGVAAGTHDHDNDHDHHHDHDPAGHGHQHALAERVAASGEGFWGTSGALTSVAVGALHGIGAETPTQVLLLAAAATAGGAAPGLFLLGAFLLGLFLSNSLVGLTVALGFLGASRNFAVYAIVSLLTGLAGMTVGFLLLTGSANLLPSLFAG